MSGNGTTAESIIEERARNGVVILDVRTLGEWNEGHVKGAKHVPIDDLRGHVRVLAQETIGKTIYVHCKGGYRGHLALRVLKEHGFQVCLVKIGGRGGGMRAPDVSVRRRRNNSMPSLPSYHMCACK